MKRLLLTVLTLLLALALPACAQDIAIDPLVPLCAPAVGGAAPAVLYCGPTQGFYHREGRALDLTQPYVLFGQDDCWAMAAQGTPDAFGPVGWIEAAHLGGAEAAPLPFDNAFEAMIEEDAAVTDDPLSPGSAWDAVLPRGTWVTVLAQHAGYLYIQCEIDGMPARVFVPAGCVL